MENMTEVTSQKSTVGQTTVSVNEIIALHDQINTLKAQTQQLEVLTAVKDEQISNLKAEQKVMVIKRGNGLWASDEISYRNLDSVVADIRKSEEAKVEKELIKLRKDIKEATRETSEANSELSELRDTQDTLISKAREDASKNADEEVVAIKKTLVELQLSFDERSADAKKSFDKKEATLLNQIKDLQLQLKDKSEAQLLEKQLKEYRNLIKELRAENDKLHSTGLIGKWLGKAVKSEDYVSRLNEAYNRLLTTTPDANVVTTKIPDNFNDFATKEVLGSPQYGRSYSGITTQRWSPWGLEREHEEIPTVTVTFKV